MSSSLDSKILLWLSLPYVSPRKQVALLKKFGSPEALWNEFPRRDEEMKRAVGERAQAELKRYRSLDYIDEYVSRLREQDISVMTALNKAYPKSLLGPGVNAPLVLYYRGNIERFADTCVAVVGTRRCTPYGKKHAGLIAGEIAASGVTVVSGLATGIDAYAHEGALDAGGNTIAVLGGGLDKVTPVANEKLFERILESGGLVFCEYRPGTAPGKFTFPERNRLISGMSRGVVVVEAGEKSGALITARLAAEQGREVFALPGNVDSTRSQGTNKLLYDGATLIRDGRDVLEFLSITPKTSREKAEIILDKELKKVYSLLEDGEKSFDELVERSGMSPADLSAALTELELRNVVTRVGAGSFMKTD